MPVLHRHLPATLSVALAGLCAGCLTLQKYPDVPPAQLDPGPPKPIMTALPPIHVESAKSKVQNVKTDVPHIQQPVSGSPQPAAHSSLADLIMGRTPPAPVIPSETFPSLGKTNLPPFQPLEKPTSPSSKPWKPPAANVENPGADTSAPSST
ncbi:MAG: hypothetical protein NTY53_01020, partial [Kiritimatiellaeota bacterium]|nr:hypothetical protein [Kiritimatiellota bacterium]